MNRTSLARVPVNLKLVTASSADLGLPNYARFKKVVAKAKEFGLDLCPAEAAPQLLLQHGRSLLTRKKELTFVMEPIFYRSLFTARGGPLLLGGDYAHSGRRWSAHGRLVFVSTF
ncbi:MAG: hypothetical protein UT37_C0001G0038 [Parcubacteria group bacterium GW2011_GWA2_39_18]|nr:MAG: hypothetical protein UT37_C0001G0038 [Parcubacteria group bacterium GW2011_GWA2_39_18]